MSAAAVVPSGPLLADAAVAAVKPDTRLRDDSTAWAADRDLYLWSAQRRVLEAVDAGFAGDGPRTIDVLAGHGVGKSHLAAALVAHHSDTDRTGRSRTLTVSPTSGQLQNVWHPFALIHGQLRLPGRPRGGPLPGWTLGGLELARGRSTSNSDPQTLQGFHAGRLLVIVDEADAIAERVMVQVETLATGEAGVVVLLGNPVNPSSPWATRVGDDQARAQDDRDRTLIRIPSTSAPAFTGEPVPAHVAGLVGRTWVEERRRAWGEHSALWQARIAAYWPTHDEHAVIPAHLTTRQRRPHDPDLDRPSQPDEHGVMVETIPILAVDVAGPGRDRSVIGRLVDRCYRTETVTRGTKVPELARMVRARAEEHPATRVIVDTTGMGQGVFDLLREWGVDAVAFVASEKPARSGTSLGNRRSEAWWIARRMLGGDTGPVAALDPTDDGALLRLDPDDEHARDLDGELTMPRWATHKTHGTILVQSKAELLKDLGRSPDLADALTMAAWLRVTGGGGGRAVAAAVVRRGGRGRGAAAGRVRPGWSGR